MSNVLKKEKASRLLLVMPPQLGLLGGFAAGLISLANYVSSHLPSLQVDILDLSSVPIQSIKRHIKEKQLQKGDFVGITTTTASYHAAIETARELKKACPRCLVVLGGHHASADAKTVLLSHHKIIDAIVVGEGEKSFVELLTNYPRLSSVSGVAFLKDNRFYCNSPPPFLNQSELDELPITFEGNGLFGTPGKFNHVTYVSARGCPLKCSFCSVGNEKMRYNSVGKVIKDIKRLVDMGFFKIAIEDNFFAHSPTRTRELCLALANLREKMQDCFTWDCQTRVESLTRKDTISLLAKAGCEAVYIGVESFNSDHLLYLNKTSRPDKYFDQLCNDVVPALINSPIDCYLNLQFGLPGEKDKHDEHTIETLNKLGSLALSKGKNIAIFPQLHVVYPATAHFYSGVSRGRFPKDVFETFTKWESKQAPVLSWLGEHFAHGTGGLPEGILKPEYLAKGRYRVDPGIVLRIAATLTAIDRIPGIRNFKYGNFLVTPNMELNRKYAKAR